MNESLQKLDFTKTFSIGKKTDEGIELAKEIYKEWDLESKDYPALLKLIREKGVKFCGDTFREVDRMRIAHRLPYFLAIVSRQEILEG